MEWGSGWDGKGFVNPDPNPNPNPTSAPIMLTNALTPALLPALLPALPHARTSRLLSSVEKPGIRMLISAERFLFLLKKHSLEKLVIAAIMSGYRACTRLIIILHSCLVNSGNL